MNTTIAFIGGGNMARSLIGGLIATDQPAGRIHVADPNADTLQQLQTDFGIKVTTDNHRAFNACDVVVLAVKPQQMRRVCRGLSTLTPAHRPLVISIAAGLRCADIGRWLNADIALVRTMPNTPALLGAGVTGLFANPHVSAAQCEVAESILAAAGHCHWVADESLIDAIAAISGSGPAYFFLFIEALSQAGHALGLTTDVAEQLAVQTALGAARMASETGTSAGALRRQVTSPGGTTERALHAFEHGDLTGLVATATRAAHRRAGELAEQLGADS